MKTLTLHTTKEFYAATSIQFAPVLRVNSNVTTTVIYTRTGWLKYNESFYLQQYQQLIYLLKKWRLLYQGQRNQFKFLCAFFSDLHPSMANTVRLFSKILGLYFYIGRWYAGSLTNLAKYKSIVQPKPLLKRVEQSETLMHMPGLPDFIFSFGMYDSVAQRELSNLAIPSITVSRPDAHLNIAQTFWIPGDCNYSLLLINYFNLICRYFYNIPNFFAYFKFGQNRTKKLQYGHKKIQKTSRASQNSTLLNQRNKSALMQTSKRNYSTTTPNQNQYGLKNYEKWKLLLSSENILQSAGNFNYNLLDEKKLIAESLANVNKPHLNSNTITSVFRLHARVKRLQLIKNLFKTTKTMKSILKYQQLITTLNNATDLKKQYQIYTFHYNKQVVNHSKADLINYKGKWDFNNLTIQQKGKYISKVSTSTIVHNLRLKTRLFRGFFKRKIYKHVTSFVPSYSKRYNRYMLIRKAHAKIPYSANRNTAKKLCMWPSNFSYYLNYYLNKSNTRYSLKVQPFRFAKPRKLKRAWTPATWNGFKKPQKWNRSIQHVFRGFIPSSSVSSRWVATKARLKRLKRSQKWAKRKQKWLRKQIKQTIKGHYNQIYCSKIYKNKKSFSQSLKQNSLFSHNASIDQVLPLYIQKFKGKRFLKMALNKTKFTLSNRGLNYRAMKAFRFKKRHRIKKQIYFPMLKSFKKLFKKYRTAKDKNSYRSAYYKGLNLRKKRKVKKLLVKFSQLSTTTLPFFAGLTLFSYFQTRFNFGSEKLDHKINKIKRTNYYKGHSCTSLITKHYANFLNVLKRLK